jgi:hypothetical protein
MAAFVLFVLAVAGGITVADLVGENTTAGQITVFHHTVTGQPEGWLLAIAAGLGFVVALLLVASLSSTKGRRARRKQLGRLRRGLGDRVVAPEPDHARLLDEFFGPEETPRHLAGTARAAGPSSAGPEGPAEGHRSSGIPGSERIEQHPEPLYEQARRAAGLHHDRDLPAATNHGRRR